MPSLYDFSAKLLDGTEVSLADWRDKVVLIVNVASKCGFTPQYAGLEALHKKYHDKGLAVLGFPCNQFGGQEPGTEMEIASFCEMNYGVTFPIFSKIDVNGGASIPMYKWLKRKAPGLLRVQLVPWNFTKFLVDRTGTKVTRFDPQVEPAALEKPIEALL